MKRKQSKSLRKLVRQRDSTFKRFPLLFTLLGTLGVVATFNGLTRLVEQVPVLANNPVITLIVGILILFMTGTLYKKLG